MPTGLLTSFLGALQASVSVLITICYGIAARQYDLLGDTSARQVSTLCVKLFLPALLLTNVGSQLSIEALPRYAMIIVWALIYNFASMLLGSASRRALKFPRWVTPFVTFNNTIAFPLLLLESLQSTGVLDSLLWGSHDTSSAALDRAKSYFLVNSMVSDSLTFSIGPWLLGVNEDKESSSRVAYEPSNAGFAPAISGGRVFESDDDDLETDMRSVDEEEEAVIAANERDSLLPNKMVRTTAKISHRSSHHGTRYWDKMPGWMQTLANLFLGFFNVPLLACIVGFVIGLVPELQKAFFGEQQDGGIFTAWLTKSVQHLGGLFATLQIVVVGVKLSNSLKNLKQGHESGPVPWGASIFVLFIRFVLWAAISIPVIWALQAHTGLLDSDPMLWFSMMLMPTGPPALGLISLADVAGDSEDSKMSIAKLLVVAYAFSPFMTFVVVGALKASLALVPSV